MAEEFEGADLGDKRRTKRLQAIVEAFAAHPDRSLPTIAASSAATEGLYRFINSKKVELTAAKVLEPHAERSEERTRRHETVLAIHDGTDIKYRFEGTLREGFGRLGDGQGIQALVSLAVSFCESSSSMTSNDEHEPLGVVACQTFTGPRERARRTKRKPQPKKPPKKGTSRWGRIAGAEWLSSAVETRRVLGRDADLVHVIDREGDAIELLARLQQDAERFVIRVLRKRRVGFGEEDDFKKITDAATVLPRLFEEHFHVSKRRRAKARQNHPPREARTARLSYAAGQIRIKKSWELTDDSSIPTFVTLNLVHVKEHEPPEGEDPIEWFLVTTDPIATEAQVRRIVRIYRARWLIEEFFRVLKTGCALEKRQVESRQALEAILAISLVVSWRILLLRHKSRLDARVPASVGFSEIELDLLQKMRKLPKGATLQEALLKVAETGGHLKQNGAPGNMALVRGLEKLEAQAEVWAFTMGKM